MSEDIIEGGIDQIGTKIGVFGGTFDPVHSGHCALVSQFKQQCGLDSVVVIPAANPPHKMNQPLTDFEHRFAMLSLVFSDIQGVYLSRLEQFRDGPSYTIDTLQQLKKGVGGNCEWFFAIGEDTLLEIHTWKKYQDIPDLVCLVVLNRTISSSYSCEDVIRKDFTSYCLTRDKSSYFENNVEKIRLLNMPAVTISSSQIRQSISTNKDCHNLLPDVVWSYIVRHALYK